MIQVGGLQNLASFPAEDHFHAGCVTTTEVQDNCATVFAHIEGTVKKFKTGGPANGLYDIVSEVDNKNVWVTRTTPTKHYVDDIQFTLTPKNGAFSAFNITGVAC